MAKKGCVQVHEKSVTHKIYIGYKLKNSSSKPIRAETDHVMLPFRTGETPPWSRSLEPSTTTWNLVMDVNLNKFHCKKLQQEGRTKWLLSRNGRMEVWLLLLRVSWWLVVSTLHVVSFSPLLTCFITRKIDFTSLPWWNMDFPMTVFVYDSHCV